MPSFSLVVCVYRERELLSRLIEHAQRLCDDLVVVHDGPDTMDVSGLVQSAGGRFFEHARVGSLEAQSPFAWAQARHDWILRLDADEFPSEELSAWLKQFRAAPEPAPAISGYTCIWPLWNGRCTVSRHMPRGRIFLFHRQRVRFFGMIEQVPVPDGRWEALPLVLEHQPARKSYGLGNLLIRKQAYRWRERIASSLLGKPTDLACWRWESAEWPARWEQIRRHPLRTALIRLTRETAAGLRDQWRHERRFFPFAALSGPLHHALICLKYLQLRGRRTRGAEHISNDAC